MGELHKIPYLQVIFNNDLRPYEVPSFRGAVISKVSQELTLFHNHLGNGFRFLYPTIQYKSIMGKAAIICVNDGTNEIEAFFSKGDFSLSVGERDELFSIKDVFARTWILQTWNESFSYSLKRWIPLNTPNYQKYSSLEGLVEKTQLLESILIGNILSMSKGLDCHIDGTIKCKIISVNESRIYQYKKVNLQGFDITFNTNIYLPDYIGVGKGASVGFGTVKLIRNSNNNQEETNDENE